MAARPLAHLALTLLLVACSSAPIVDGTSPSQSLSASASSSARPRRVVALTVTSPSIHAGRPIPPHNSCRTDDVSPSLRWSRGPKGTVEYAVIFDDPDALPRPFAHWTVWDIPPSPPSIPERVLPRGAHQGRNDVGVVDYSGPCFPERSNHRYRFTVYALSGKPNLAQGAPSGIVRARIAPLTLGVGSLVAKGY